MKTSRYSSSRQKSCKECAGAKARCDRTAGQQTCKRCSRRCLECTYVQLVAVEGLGSRAEHEACAAGRLDQRCSSNRAASSLQATDQPPSNARASDTGEDALEFTDLDLDCPIDVDDIQNRWLNPYIPFPGQTVKQYPTNVKDYLFRLFKSYVDMIIRGRAIPPFIHTIQLLKSQITPPLSACLELLPRCKDVLTADRRMSLARAVEAEMTNIFQPYATFDVMTLLAAFQAYMLYCMVLFFHLEDPNAILRQAMMNLQELACATCRQGIVSVAEQQHHRPKWESWVVAETKRRTLYTMFMFDNVLSAQDGLPTYLSTEVRGLAAPGPKSLWQAHTRRAWETSYDQLFDDLWAQEDFMHIDELWPRPDNMNPPAIAERQRRTEVWLEDIDEFGMAIFAVSSITHGT